ncbi:hydrogen gas-evolving membrane-bound hydrogenase subunit E [Halomonas sp. GXIMD04776]|uniref:hydrogen gas-evolving membrane-bound hydrogenase subunit E n=1 Tax=Halomonas sp. GXIMD04776 TaxID=3415605 RepID=UPI003CB01E57
MSTLGRDSALPRPIHISLAVVLFVLGLVLAWALWKTSNDPTSLTDTVMRKLPQSGVSNPVTAVLLNFRAFDTMLELTVLLVVAIAVGMLRVQDETPPVVNQQAAPRNFSPLLRSLTRDLTPIMILVSAYLLWVGAKEPGGAFQAGAVLAAVGVLAHTSKRPWLADQEDGRIRALLALGTGAFLISALVMMAVTGIYFGYPREWAGAWILAIETGATLSIATVLYVTFSAVMPAQGRL